MFYLLLNAVHGNFPVLYQIGTFLVYDIVAKMI